MRSLVFVVALSCWGFAAGAAAQYHEPGGYLQFGGSATFEDFDLPSSFDVDEGFIIDPAVGYRLNSVLAFEFQGRYLDEMDIDAPGDHAEVDAWSLFFNTKFYAPIPWRVQPFVKFGAGYTEIDVDGNDFDDVGLSYGAGFELALDEGVSLGIEGHRFEGVDDLNNFDYWSAGAFLKFWYR